MVTSLSKPRNIASGVSDGVYLAPLSWFAPGGLKKPAGDGLLITDTHLFLTGNDGFFFAQLAPQKNSFTSKTIGELASLQFELELKVFIPGSSEEGHATMQKFINVPLVALVKDANCEAGFFYQLGSSCKPAWLSPVFASGNGKDGSKGYEITVLCNAKSIVLYEGMVTVMEDFPDRAVPVFGATRIDNSSLAAMRSSYLALATRNITNIYNICKGGQVSNVITAYFRNSASVAMSRSLGSTDISTFSKFLDWLDLALPADISFRMYSTGLLAISTITIEHYLGVEARDMALLHDDGFFLLDSDGGRLLTI